MKISDLTPELFNEEMKALLELAKNHAGQLNMVLGEIKYEPTQEIGDRVFPFAWAKDIWELWEFASGNVELPRQWLHTSQKLRQILWCPMGHSTHGYKIPPEFWQTPLGLVCKVADIRYRLHIGGDMTVEDLAILSSITKQYIHNALLKGSLGGHKVEGKWKIGPPEARAFVEAKERSRKKVKIHRYVFGNSPDLLPIGEHEDTYWPDDAERLIRLCGENPGDEELVFVDLTEDWKKHKAGTMVLVGTTYTGHPFYVIEIE